MVCELFSTLNWNVSKCIFGLRNITEALTLHNLVKELCNTNFDVAHLYSNDNSYGKYYLHRDTNIKLLAIEIACLFCLRGEVLEQRRFKHPDKEGSCYCRDNLSYGR